MGATKFILVRHLRATCALFEITMASILFSRKFWMQLESFTKVRIFSDSYFYRIYESENFRFPFSSENTLIWGVKCEILNFRKS